MRLKHELKGEIWCSTDFHLSHKNITGPEISNWKQGYRHFPTIHEMNKTIIDSINKYIGQEDTLFFNGDFYFGEKSKMQNIRDQIICQNIIYILGNHDKEEEIIKVFGHFYDVCEFNYQGLHFFLSHYAHRVWNKSHRDSIHLYGHSHDSLDKKGEEWGRSMDISMESALRIYGEMRPFHFINDIIPIMNKRKTKILDHHGKDRED